MVAPTTGKLKSIINEVAVQLGTVDGLTIYKYPEADPRQLPCAVITDAPLRTSEYKATAPEAVYVIQVLILVEHKDHQAAYEQLEKYISADSPSSVKALMNNAVVAGVASIECKLANRREWYQCGRRHALGCMFEIKATVT